MFSVISIGFTNVFAISVRCTNVFVINVSFTNVFEINSFNVKMKTKIQQSKTTQNNT